MSMKSEEIIIYAHTPRENGEITLHFKDVLLVNFKRDKGNWVVTSGVVSGEHCRVGAAYLDNLSLPT